MAVVVPGEGSWGCRVGRISPRWLLMLHARVVDAVEVVEQL